MRKLLLSVLILVASSFTFAAEGKQVTYRSGDEQISAMLYMPAAASSSTGKAKAGKLPAIILIHEWWGLNDQIKGLASQWADDGYVTLAVDLYRGKSTTDPEEAHELMRGLPDDRAVRDLRAAFTYLTHQPQVDARRIGVMGWCMGGGFALELALAEPHIAAVAMNYGHLVTDVNTLKKLHAPLLGLFGGQDRGILPADVKKFEARLKKLGKNVEIKIYDDTGHAFQNPNNKQGYNAADTADAQKLQHAFFARTLKKAK